MAGLRTRHLPLYPQPYNKGGGALTLMRVSVFYQWNYLRAAGRDDSDTGLYAIDKLWVLSFNFD